MHIKICCIRSAAEARLAMARGATALGLVSHMPSGPGVIDEATIAEIAAGIPPAVQTVLLTSRTEVADIVAQQRRCGVDALQLCEPLPPATLEALRGSLPEVALMPVVHVGGPESVDEAVTLGRIAHALLLDTGTRTGPDRQLGGTGRTHDWSVSAEIVRRVPVPVYLAGGLRPDNVRRAIATVAPHGVDVCSGVRMNGDLDPDLLARFVAAVRAS